MNRHERHDTNSFPAGRAQWETEKRWYTATVLRDLFGGWLVEKEWGGQGRRPQGKKTVLVDDEAAGLQVLSQVHAARIRRPRPYSRII